MAQSPFAGPPRNDTPFDDCLGRSCMKWGQNGELSPLDLQSILERLSAVDDQASGLLDCPVERP